MMLDLKRGGSLGVIATLSVVFGFASVFLSELFAVFSIAYLAATMVFDKTPKKIWSLVASILIVVANVLCLIFFNSVTLTGFMTVAVGAVIALCFRFHRTKNECVLASVTVVALFTVGSFLLLLLQMADEFGLSSAMEAYNQTYEALKNEFVGAVGDITSGAVGGTTEVTLSAEDVALMFDGVANLGVAMVILLSLAIVGVAFKVFTRVVDNSAKDGSSVREWRFCPSGVFGYFYIALYLITMFAGEMTVFSLTVMNLYYVFMAVFAYFGFGVAVAFLSHARSRTFAYLSVVGALVLFSTIAFQILSLVGVFFAINYKKARQD